jgi:thioredoxin-related protein
MMRTILACVLLVAGGAASAAEPGIARDLAAQARPDRPVVLFFTLAGCPFCERARRSYLAPLARGSGNRLTVLEVPVEARVTGFDHRQVSGRDLARAYGVSVFPTVLVVDNRGQPLAEALPGFSVPDFYGALLDARIERAIARLTGS